MIVHNCCPVLSAVHNCCPVLSALIQSLFFFFSFFGGGGVGVLGDGKCFFDRMDST